MPVLALSQVNRNVDNRMSKKLFLSDLRESGAIEQDADLILFLYNEKDDGGQAAPNEDIALEIGKQRNGPVGKITVEFQKRTPSSAKRIMSTETITQARRKITAPKNFSDHPSRCYFFLPGVRHVRLSG